MPQFPSTTNAKDIWTLTDQYRAKAGSNWPSSGPANITYVGGQVFSSSTTISLSSFSAQVGDLCIIVAHNFPSNFTSMPSGFTRAFTTAANQYGYAKDVLFKTVSSSSEQVNVTTNGSGFDGTVVVLRGATSVSATYIQTDVNFGDTSPAFAVSNSGFAIAIASDRGATGLPNITSLTGSLTVVFVGSASFFQQRTGLLANYSGTGFSFTDYDPDSYGTMGLLFVAQ
jgi:hypothetical protein